MPHECHREEVLTTAQREVKGSLELLMTGQKAATRDFRALFLDDNQLPRPLLRLTPLPSVSVGVQPKITDGDLALVGNMRSHPGDELAPFLNPLRMAGRRKSAGAAGKH